MRISTSILDCQDRIGGVIQLNRTHTSYIHIDVMDGEFVPNIQFKEVHELKAINRVSKYPLDVHLMVMDPIEYVENLENMNIEYITFHLELAQDISKIISKIKEKGYKVGLSIKPSTDIAKLECYLKDIDLVLVMSVEPGLGGQKFLIETVDRVNELKKIIDENHYSVQIEVDGGINAETIVLLNQADIVVVGSYIVKSDNYYKRIEELLCVVRDGVQVGNLNESKHQKKKLFYKILLGIGIIPFGLVFGSGFYSMIFGYSGICILNCTSYYGWVAFRNSTFLLVWLFWPILVIGLLFIVISIMELKKIKRLSN